MSRNINLILIPLLVVMSCVATTTAANQVSDSRGPEWIKGLLSDNVNEQKQATLDAREERVELIHVLSSLLEEDVSAANRTRVASAIKIAGSMRIEEVSRQLIRKIDFLEFGVLNTRRPFTPRQDYIAVDALVRIGNAAIDPALQRLSTETEPRNRQLLVVVLKEVEGRELARGILEKAAQQMEGQNRENLMQAVILLESIPERQGPRHN